MKQIGFKNFRRFENLDPIDLGPVTFLVGENNAGKSTVVKAILAILGFIKTRVSAIEDDSWLNVNFSFNKSYYTHLGTFERARYNHAHEDDPIVFIVTLGDRRYEITAERPVLDDSTYGRVSQIKVTILPFNTDIVFSLRSDRSVNIVFHNQPYPNYDISQYYAAYTVKRYFRFFEHRTHRRDDIEFYTTLVEDDKFSSEYIVDALLRSVLTRIAATKLNMVDGSFVSTEKGLMGGTLESSFFFSNGETIRSKRFMAPKQKEIDVEYIYAHAVTQTILFSAKDTNDYAVKTIHEFANLQVSDNTPVKDFIIKWMKVFQIGQDYSVTSVGGEAHLVRILGSDGKWINLSDKGMGSIHLMILLYRIATKMVEAGIGYGNKKANTLFLIEEPEQNLHPRLQSMLADLFYELYQKYGFRFVVETHSEYLIRKSQVLVGEAYKTNMDFVNPFKVYYFPSEGDPYDLPYAKSGRFEEQFGTGFFDEASKWNREILKNENAR